MQPMLMFLKFHLIIQNVLRILGHVVLNVTEKHWDREDIGRRY